MKAMQAVTKKKEFNKRFLGRKIFLLPLRFMHSKIPAHKRFIKNCRQEKLIIYATNFLTKIGIACFLAKWQNLCAKYRVNLAQVQS